MNKLMCHVVAGYPDEKACLELMKGMDEAGVSAIEVQIPFSDPIADGETIMHANDVALEAGMTTADSFKLINKAREEGIGCDIYIMSYIQKVQHFGFEAFCDQASSCGVKGLIIPDMPYDSPEYSKLADCAKGLSLSIVPVLSPGMPEERRNAILEKAPLFVYVTSQRGITGNAYNDTQALHQLVATIHDKSDTMIMIGFGISTAGDVRSALTLGDIAIVGSAIIKKFQADGLTKTLEYVEKLAEAAA